MCKSYLNGEESARSDDKTWKMLKAISGAQNFI